MRSAARSADRISEGIRGIKGVTPVYEDPNCKHVYHLYTLCIEPEELGASRDDFLRVLYARRACREFCTISRPIISRVSRRSATATISARWLRSSSITGR